jgi:hypothetical protein
VVISWIGPPKAQETKAKIDKWDYIKQKKQSTGYGSNLENGRISLPTIHLAKGYYQK